MHKAYQVELKPNNIQAAQLYKHTAAKRIAYNWGLEKKKAAYEAGQKTPSYCDLSKDLPELKSGERVWLKECSCIIFQQALRDLETAYKNFFDRIKKGVTGKPAGFPKFKKMGKCRDSFRINGTTPKVTDSHIKLPIIGWVKLKQKNYVPLNKKILSVTISRKANRWFASVLIEEDEKEVTPPKNEVIGVDLGIHTLLTCSDNTTFENPKALAIQKATSKIVAENQIIILEDLNVSGMLKNSKLSKSIGDAAFYEIRRQIEYKAKWSRREVTIADRYFASSKICSRCGSKKDNLKLSDRIYNCENCGLNLDRDLNAALNLKQYYLIEIIKNTLSSREISSALQNDNACGDERFISNLFERCSSENFSEILMACSSFILVCP